MTDTSWTSSGFNHTLAPQNEEVYFTLPIVCTHQHSVRYYVLEQDAAAGNDDVIAERI